MIDGIRVKVCGITSRVDADLAVQCGADCLGFILHPQSPRYLDLEQYRAMAPGLPACRKVAVSVEPTLDEVEAMRAAGFDFFQIHFRLGTPDEQLAAWSRAVGKDHLWLAPKLPPGEEVSAPIRAVAKFVMLDTFHEGGFGGSGQTGDWTKFARQQARHPENEWILAGGLNAANIGGALIASQARFVDVASGVEAAPGVKDEARLKAFVIAVGRAAGERAAASRLPGGGRG